MAVTQQDLEAEIERLNSALQGSVISNRRKKERIAELEATLREAKEALVAWQTLDLDEQHCDDALTTINKALGEE